MPSDLPLMSTGRAMYPVPPQRGQSFGSTDPPQLLLSFSPIRVRSVTKLILLRNTNTESSRDQHRRGIHTAGSGIPRTHVVSCVQSARDELCPHHWRVRVAQGIQEIQAERHRRQQKRVAASREGVS